MALHRDEEALPTAARIRRFVAHHRRTLLAAMLVAIVPLAFAAVQIDKHPRLSPIDEKDHLDSAYELSHGHLVRRGDVLAPATVQTVACRLIDAPGYASPDPCGDQIVTSSTQNDSYMHPPLYYLVTGSLARLLGGVGMVASFVTAARLVNTLWLAGGSLIIFGLLGEFGLSRRRRVAGALIPLLAPMVLFQGATVTNDVTAIPAGAAVLWLAIRFRNARGTTIGLAVVSVTAVWLRATNIFGVAIAGVFLAVAALQDPVSRRRCARAAVVVVGSAAAAAALWTSMIGWIASVPAGDFSLRATFPRGLHAADLIRNVTPMIPPTQGLPDVAPWNSSALIALQVAVLGWLLISGPLLALARPERDRAISIWPALGASTILVSLATGPALVLVNRLSADSYLGYPLASRLGLSLLPALVVCTIGCSRSRRSDNLAVVLVLLGLSSTLLTLLSA